MAKKISSTTYFTSNSTKRKGIHSKCNSSQLKSSKNYKKKYKGQGR